ncbi:hypothetical protein [Thalassoroseus pseudoceratinae]|uniref:hypothetical protein n=1 Tax=Thalassoroseus pseudoceratinae TaxID=2713176 RepID=UPI0014201D6F|nr:hypothetical protein [Thalassoroseus pseudoceratinae]
MKTANPKPTVDQLVQRLIEFIKDDPVTLDNFDILPSYHVFDDWHLFEGEAARITDDWSVFAKAVEITAEDDYGREFLTDDKVVEYTISPFNPDTNEFEDQIVLVHDLLANEWREFWS